MPFVENKKQGDEMTNKNCENNFKFEGWILSDGAGSALSNFHPSNELSYSLIPLFMCSTFNDGFIVTRTKQELKPYLKQWKAELKKSAFSPTSKNF